MASEKEVLCKVLGLEPSELCCVKGCIRKVRVFRHQLCNAHSTRLYRDSVVEGTLRPRRKHAKFVPREGV